MSERSAESTSLSRRTRVVFPVVELPALERAGFEGEDFVAVKDDFPDFPPTVSLIEEVTFRAVSRMTRATVATAPSCFVVEPAELFFGELFACPLPLAAVVRLEAVARLRAAAAGFDFELLEAVEVLDLLLAFFAAGFFVDFVFLVAKRSSSYDTSAVDAFAYAKAPHSSDALGLEVENPMDPLRERSGSQRKRKGSELPAKYDCFATQLGQTQVGHEATVLRYAYATNAHRRETADFAGARSGRKRNLPSIYRSV